MSDELKLPFHQLSHWQHQLFAAALLERMLPNYQCFSKLSGYGEYSVLLNQLDIIWQKLLKEPITINLESQLEKLEKQIPDVSRFEVLAVYPALDVCSGLVCLLQSLDEADTRCAEEVSLLSRSMVHFYVNACMAENEAETVTRQYNEEEINNDPLMQWEFATQKELFNFVMSINLTTATKGALSKDEKKLLREFKQSVKSERVTNLGVEY